MRDIYEVPAAAIILPAHQELEKLVCTIHQNQFKAGLDRQWAYLVYAGLWWEPLRGDLDAYMDVGQRAGQRHDRDRALQGHRADRHALARRTPSTTARSRPSPSPAGCSRRPPRPASSSCGRCSRGWRGGCAIAPTPPTASRPDGASPRSPSSSTARRGPRPPRTATSASSSSTGPPSARRPADTGWRGLERRPRSFRVGSLPTRCAPWTSIQPGDLADHREHVARRLRTSGSTSRVSASRAASSTAPPARHRDVALADAQIVERSRLSRDKRARTSAFRKVVGVLRRAARMVASTSAPGSSTRRTSDWRSRRRPTPTGSASAGPGPCTSGRTGRRRAQRMTTRDTVFMASTRVCSWRDCSKDAADPAYGNATLDWNLDRPEHPNPEYAERGARPTGGR